MDSYFSARYGKGMPFLAWDIAVTEKCVEIAQWKLLNIRGYNPAAGADVNVRDRWVAALAWCAGVERQRIHPKVTLSPAPYQGADAPLVLSQPLQGWIPPNGSSGI
jgi:phage gp36-like protein